MGQADTSMGGAAGEFPSTALSGLLESRSTQPERYREHLEAVALRYWKPVYRFIRRGWSKGDADAKDLVQAFFVHLLEHQVLLRFDPARGSFRAYLKQCIRNFLSVDARDAGRIRRGGGRVPLSIEALEEAAGAMPETAATPEEEFDDGWTREVLELSVAELERDLERRGKGRIFEIFQSYALAQDSERSPSYRDVAERFGVTESDVTNHLHTARRELGAIVGRRIGEYVRDDEEAETERRRILGVKRRQ